MFRLAGVDRRTSPFVDVVLRSGDLLVFGGANRRIYHGVPKVLDGTGPAGPWAAAGPAEHHGAGDRAVTRSRSDGAGRWHHVPVRPFDHVVREHGDVVMRVCRALLPPADAEDAWSETFLAAIRAYPALRPDSNVRGWLVTIAHRKALDQLRGRARRATPAGDLPEAATHDPEPADDGLRAAVAALPDKQRAAIVLHHVAGLPYADIAAELGGTVVAARRAAADGIARLRVTIGGSR